jgi:hypothetical protein
VTADDLPIEAGVVSENKGDAMVTVDCCCPGKHYFTAEQARKLASQLIVNAMRVEELNRIPGAPVEAYD